MLKIEKLDFEDARHERKFVVSDMKLYEIENIIKLNPIGFSKMYPERNINNIYFDSMYMESYNNNIEGNSKRIKIRIRWYGELFGWIKNPILEIKIRNSELGKKLMFPLKSFKLDKNFTKEYLYKEILLKSDLPKWLVEEIKLYDPKLLNRYTRKYFICFEKTHRITLDYDLISYRINNQNNSFNKKRLNKRDIILEIKYDKKDHKKTSDITKFLPFRLTKSSKYVTGIELLNN